MILNNCCLTKQAYFIHQQKWKQSATVHVYEYIVTMPRMLPTDGSYFSLLNIHYIHTKLHILIISVFYVENVLYDEQNNKQTNKQTPLL
jgi:hypothetical protein